MSISECFTSLISIELARINVNVYLGAVMNLTIFVYSLFTWLFGQNYTDAATVSAQRVEFPSKELNRTVILDLYLPNKVDRNTALILLNDGQDLTNMGFEKVLEKLGTMNKPLPFIAVGIHTNENRMQEYGTASRPDYAGRGKRASAYSHFIVKELIPYLQTTVLKKNQQQFYMAGWSLGGLSAFDIAWNHPHLFKGAAVFSGSFWWRSQEFDASNPDGHRIIFEVVKNKRSDPNQRFWMMATDQEEKDDRNNNGIIDVVDDTIQLTELLHQQGTPAKNIAFTRLPTGAHHTDTWAKELEPMLRWIFNLH